MVLAQFSDLSLALSAEAETPRIGEVSLEVSPVIQGAGGLQTLKVITQLSSTC
jgi:hypothetical protein